MDFKIIDVFMLFLRIELFLFGVVFTAGGAIIKGQFNLHGRISSISGHCSARHPEIKKASKTRN
jgi:uncharacterized membrane protein YkvI